MFSIFNECTKIINSTMCYVLDLWTTLSKLKVPWKVPENFEVSFINFFQLIINYSFSISVYMFFKFLNSNFRLQSLHTPTSSKLWHHLIPMELFILENHLQICTRTIKNQVENKNRSNECHDFVHYITDLIGVGGIYFLFFIEQHMYHWSKNRA